MKLMSNLFWGPISMPPEYQDTEKSIETPGDRWVKNFQLQIWCLNISNEMFKSNNSHVAAHSLYHI